MKLNHEDHHSGNVCNLESTLSFFRKRFENDCACVLKIATLRIRCFKIDGGMDSSGLRRICS